jgi:hypothetical protein
VDVKVRRGSAETGSSAAAALRRVLDHNGRAADAEVGRAVASLVGAAPVTGVDTALAVAAVVGASTVEGNAIGCCAAGGTAVAVALDAPHAFSSAAPADMLSRVNTCFRNARRVVA